MFLFPHVPALDVAVSPQYVAVEVGAEAKFECAAIGNLVEGMKWSRDIRDFTKRDVSVHAYSKSHTVYKLIP